jgi:predicted glycosyltransferase involved in capsule biosynthesis
MPVISFLLPARHRVDDVRRICKYLLPQITRAECELIFVEETAFSDRELSELLVEHGVKCLRVDSDRKEFHKTRLLNHALSESRGDYVIPLDADLLPMFSIDTLCSLVTTSPQLIIGGYRVMSGYDDSSVNSYTISVPKAAPEDCSGAIYKQLMQGERFMVCPAYNRLELLSIGGWDEEFVGWGCEDQDVLERYCKSTKRICARSRDLLYLHFDHCDQNGWNEPELVQANRVRYYSRNR